MRTSLRASLLLCVFAACGEDDPTQSEVKDEIALDGCRSPRRFVITEVTSTGPTCLGTSPIVGDLVVLGDGRLRVGQHNLAWGPVEQCVLTAQGCTGEPETGALQTLTATLDVPKRSLVLSAESWSNFRVEPCTPVTLALAPVDGACQLTGRYAVESATLTSGTCDLEWDADDVRIDVVDASIPMGTLSWGSTFDVSVVDRKACSVTADSGDFFIYNDALRQVRVRATVTGDDIAFAIEDQLDGATMIDQTCVAARFEATGTRIEPDGEPWDTTCGALPYVCGDGVCAEDAGESCGNCLEDCACADPTNCVRFTPPGEDERYTCTTTCTNGTCPGDSRCVIGSEFSAFMLDAGFPSELCLPRTGTAPRGSACTDSRICADGLTCGEGQCLERCESASTECAFCRPIHSVGLCLPRCSTDTPDTCGAGHCAMHTSNYMCQTSGDLPWTCAPSTFQATCRSETPPDFGARCDDARLCSLELGCLGIDCERVGNDFVCPERRCTSLCTTNADCAAPLGTCKTFGGFGATPAVSWCVP